MSRLPRLRYGKVHEYNCIFQVLFHYRPYNRDSLPHWHTLSHRQPLDPFSQAFLRNRQNQAQAYRNRQNRVRQHRNRQSQAQAYRNRQNQAQAYRNRQFCKLNCLLLTVSCCILICHICCRRLFRICLLACIIDNLDALAKNSAYTGYAIEPEIDYSKDTNNLKGKLTVALRPTAGNIVSDTFYGYCCLSCLCIIPVSYCVIQDKKTKAAGSSVQVVISGKGAYGISSVIC